MKFSNSKISSFYNCPFVYHLSYDLGISPKIKPKALDFGSAVHWGLEHNTSNLEKFYNENKNLENFKNDDSRILQEVMVQTYLDNKQQIINKILGDAKLLGEYHEIELNTKIKSKYNIESHDFMGIIDLLLYTDKGFIIVDYKTSSKKPNYDDYLQQLYTYIILCKSEFPDVPVYKIAIINLQKSGTRRKNQTELQYRKQLEKEYVLVDDDDDLIRVNVFDRNTILDSEIEKFENDLTNKCDYMNMVSDIANKNKIWYINWDNLKEYGGSPYLPLCNKEKYSWELYKVKDKYLSNDKIIDYRPMRKIDFDNIYNEVPIYLCRYEYFKMVYKTNPSKIFEMSDDSNVDDELIAMYTKLYQIENKSK